MLKHLLSVFLESRCAFCQRTTAVTLCQYCYKKLASHQLKREKYTIRLASSLQIRYSNLPVFAWGKYDGELKRAIALMKYNNKPEIGELLGQLLGQAWLDSKKVKPQQKITVIPIPLHRQKLRDRGFNQAEVIARSFCQITGYSLNSQALVRVRNTKAMFDLNPEERVSNLQNAFKLGKKLPKHPVILLDDIYTMGTTVGESARILLRHDIKVMGTVVVAKTVESRNVS